MGHEIVYCYWCSGRILGAEFDKGSAVLIGNHACCSQCLPKVMASLPANQRETLLSELTRAGESRPPVRNTPRAGTDITSTRTPRIGSPIPASSRSSISPMLLYGLGGGALVLIGILVLMMSGGSAERPAVRRDPPPPPTPQKTAG